MIESSAVVSSKAEVGNNVSIGAYAVIEEGVSIGDDAVIDAHAIVKRGTRLGAGVRIGHHAVVGGEPQDFSFDPNLETFLEIGAGTVVRESVTISRATKEGAATRIGEKCYLMATSHVAHDCQVGDQVVMANACLLAGHVEVGDNVFFGGAAAVHQFCRIGAGVMCGGMSIVSQDIPPFTMHSERNALFGLNLVGLRRRKVSREAIRALQRCYKEIFNTKDGLKAAAEAMLAGSFGEMAETRQFLEFFRGGSHRRGFTRPTAIKES